MKPTHLRWLALAVTCGDLLIAALLLLVLALS
jgi:hypothetical protein